MNIYVWNDCIVVNECTLISNWTSRLSSAPWFQVKSSQVKDILLHNITSVHTLNTETEAYWGLFASVILAFVTYHDLIGKQKKGVSKGAICQCAIPCCGGRHHIITITWNGIISAIKQWYSTILASYLFVHEICSHILFEKINGGGILNI